jgi:ferredoxin
MPHVICDPCIGEKRALCVEECPVDAIHPKPSESNFDLEAQLYIDPSTCTDCAQCVSVCPVSAIFLRENVPLAFRDAIDRNAAYFGQ